MFDDILGEPIYSRSPQIEDHVLAALKRAHDQAQLNPEIKAATQRSYQRALNILIHSQENFSYGPGPYIVVPGDGGVIVEWAVGDNFVSVNIDALNHEMDLIYVQQNEQEGCQDFSYDTLDDLLITLFTGEELAIYFPTASALSSAARASLPWSDFAGSTASSYPNGKILGAEG